MLFRVSQSRCLVHIRPIGIQTEVEGARVSIIVGVQSESVARGEESTVRSYYNKSFGWRSFSHSAAVTL